MPNQPKQNTARIEIYIPEDLKAAAKIAAENNGESVSEVVRRELKLYVRATQTAMREYGPRDRNPS